MPALNRLALLLLAAPALLAAPPAGFPVTWARLQGGSLTENNSDCIKHTVGYGAGVGQWLTSLAGWELDAVTGQLKDKAGLWKANEVHLDLSLLLAPPTDWNVKPFLRAGGGVSQLDQPLALVPRSSTRANYVGGLGLQMFFGEHGLATLEVRGMTVRTSVARGEMQALVGIGLRFGGAAAAPARGQAEAGLPPPRPMIERVQPAPGQAPAVQPVPPASGRAPAVQPAPPAQGAPVRPAPPAPGPPPVQKVGP